MSTTAASRETQQTRREPQPIHAQEEKGSDCKFRSVEYVARPTAMATRPYHACLANRASIHPGGLVPIA
jgi:hypothetical protein